MNRSSIRLRSSLRPLLHLLVGGLLFTLSGCASTEGDRTVTQEPDVIAGEPATIYFIRGKTIPYLRAPKVKIDGQQITKLKSSSYIVFDVSPGKREFVLDWPWDASPTNKLDERFTHDVKPGETIYFEYGSVESDGRGMRAGSVAGTSYPIATKRTYSVYYLRVVDEERLEVLKGEGYVAQPLK